MPDCAALHPLLSVGAKPNTDHGVKLLARCADRLEGMPAAAFLPSPRLRRVRVCTLSADTHAELKWYMNSYRFIRCVLLCAGTVRLIPNRSMVSKRFPSLLARSLGTVTVTHRPSDI